MRWLWRQRLRHMQDHREPAGSLSDVQYACTHPIRVAPSRALADGAGAEFAQVNSLYERPCAFVLIRNLRGEE